MLQAGGTALIHGHHDVTKLQLGQASTAQTLPRRVKFFSTVRRTRAVTVAAHGLHGRDGRVTAASAATAAAATSATASASAAASSSASAAAPTAASASASATAHRCPEGPEELSQ